MYAESKREGGEGKGHKNANAGRQTILKAERQWPEDGGLLRMRDKEKEGKREREGSIESVEEI